MAVKSGFNLNTFKDSFAKVPAEMWADIDSFSEEDLAAFDDCFDPNEDFLTDETLAVVDRAAKTKNRKRFQETKQRPIAREKKRRKSMELLSRPSYRNCDASVVSSDYTASDASVQSAQLPLMTPFELDQQLNRSMSRLALSMKRSELSRQKVIENGTTPYNSTALGFSRMFLFGSKKPYTFRRGNHLLTSGNVHISAHMAHLGRTL